MSDGACDFCFHEMADHSSDGVWIPVGCQIEGCDCINHNEEDEK